MASLSMACVNKPFHPSKSFKFPTRKYGSINCSCQHSWFSDTCQTVIKEKKIHSSTQCDQAFVSLI